MKSSAVDRTQKVACLLDWYSLKSVCDAGTDTIPPEAGQFAARKTTHFHHYRHLQRQRPTTRPDRQPRAHEWIVIDGTGEGFGYLHF